MVKHSSLHGPSGTLALVTAKSGFDREERKVRAVRILVSSSGSGAGSAQVHLPQHPPPAGPPARQSRWQMLALDSLLLSETLISFKLREMHRESSQVIAAGITLYLSLPEMSTQTG